jgi:Cd2+/Zn2+-exporting ATPase
LYLTRVPDQPLLVASIGNAALRGSLVKKGSTVEALARVDTVVFDKTGTLTTGEPRLLDTVSPNGIHEDALLQLAATAERFSEHPLGQALVRAAHERQLTVSDPDEFEQLAGLGVSARTNGSQLLLGRTTLLAERGVSVSADAEARASALAAPGRSVIPLAVNGKLAGLFVLEDTLRLEAKATIKRLHELGLRTALVSGDRPRDRRPRRRGGRNRRGARRYAAPPESRDRPPPASRRSPRRVRR